jgi:excisionase family DNA binding protein
MASIRDLLRPEQLAKRLGLSRDTVDDWMKQGMPYIKKGKFVFIPQSDFLKWMRLDLKNEVKDEKTEGDRPKQTALSLVSKV